MIHWLHWVALLILDHQVINLPPKHTRLLLILGSSTIYFNALSILLLTNIVPHFSKSCISPFCFPGNGKTSCVRMEIPKLPAIFTGTGDLFASLLLAWMQKHPNDLKLACEKTMSAVQSVLNRTLKAAQGGSGNMFVFILA